ncbi:MAG: helix-turn-helix transcriptional regulator [Actinomycetales bacterium]
MRSDRDDAASVVEVAKALGDPSRHALFAALQEAATDPSRATAGVTVAELAGRFALHPNAIRQHLSTLRGVGLIEQETSPAGRRGRPALRYRVVPGALQAWGSPGPQAELSAMLLDLALTGHSPVEVGREHGARLAGEGGTSSPATDSATGVAAGRGALMGVARRLGFEPEAVGPDEIVLHRCPFADEAERAREIICALHRGIAEGICRALGGSLVVDDLIIEPPRQAGCRLLLSG